MNKFKACKTIVDGICFASKKEATRYQQLKFFERHGRIKNLTLQPSFELQPKFEKNGIKYQAIKYVADFMYFDLDKKKEVIEDTKGVKTPVYLLKKKMFEFKYLDKQLIEL